MIFQEDPRWWFYLLFFIFTPTWGRWTHCDEHIFQMGGKKPPTRTWFGAWSIFFLDLWNLRPTAEVQIYQGKRWIPYEQPRDGTCFASSCTQQWTLSLWGEQGQQHGKCPARFLPRCFFSRFFGGNLNLQIFFGSLQKNEIPWCPGFNQKNNEFWRSWHFLFSQLNSWRAYRFTCTPWLNYRYLRYCR